MERMREREREYETDKPTLMTLLIVMAGARIDRNAGKKWIDSLSFISDRPKKCVHTSHKHTLLLLWNRLALAVIRVAGKTFFHFFLSNQGQEFNARYLWRRFRRRFRWQFHRFFEPVIHKSESSLFCVGTLISCSFPKIWSAFFLFVCLRFNPHSKSSKKSVKVRHLRIQFYYIVWMLVVPCAAKRMSQIFSWKKFSSVNIFENLNAINISLIMQVLGWYTV